MYCRYLEQADPSLTKAFSSVTAVLLSDRGGPNPVLVDGYRQYVMTITSSVIDAFTVTMQYTNPALVQQSVLPWYGHRLYHKIVPFTAFQHKTNDFTVLFPVACSLNIRPTPYARVLIESRSVGPILVSTVSDSSDVPFTVVFTAQPLFLENIRYIQRYKGPTGDTTALAVKAASMPGLWEYDLVRKLLDYELRANISYVASSTDVGKVVSATVRSDYGEDDKAPKYAIAFDVVVNISSLGSQNSVVVGAENPANYTKRAYIPRRGSYDEMAFVPIQPVALRLTTKGAVAASGRLLYEHSNLLVQEPPCTKFIVTASVRAGRGVIYVGSDQIDFEELPEYERQ